jgi:uncharacterized protein YjiS (DUF1127 family)
MFPAITSLGAAALMHAAASQGAAAQHPRQPASHSARAVPITGHATAVWSRFVAWRMRRATRVVLCSLDDRTLDDIGLKRSEIDRVLRDLHVRSMQWRV